MPTTTIRIDDDRKARVAAAAERAGKTVHAFILDAIAQTVEQAELDDAIHRVADEHWAKILAAGKTMPWDDAKAWIEAIRVASARVNRWRASLGADRPRGSRRTRGGSH